MTSEFAVPGQAGVPGPAPGAPFPVATEFAVPTPGALTNARPDAPRGVLEGVWQAVQAHYEQSSTGLAVRGRLPETQMPKDPTLAEDVAGTLAGLAGDAPAMVFGGVAGAPAGPLGIATGAFAAPGVIRGYLMSAYRTGGVNTWGDLWEASKGAFHEGTSGAAIGAGTAGPGLLAAKIASPVAKAAAIPLAEWAGMTTTAAALQGRLPTKRELEVAAVLIGGFRSLPYVREKLYDIYDKAGVDPNRVVADALADPKLREELTGQPAPMTIEQQVLRAATGPRNTVAYQPWGDVPGGTTDPAKIGTGIRGADQPSAKIVGLEYTSAVVYGSKYSEPSVQSRQPYVGEIPAEKIYVASSKDPLLAQAREEALPVYGPNAEIAWALYAKKAKDLGFDAILFNKGQMWIFTGQKVSKALDIAEAQKLVPEILRVTEARARELAIEHNQESYFQYSTGKTIYVNKPPVPEKYAELAAAENLKRAIPDLTPEQIARGEAFVADPFAPWAQGPGEKVTPTRVNYNYLNTRLDIKGAVEKIAELSEPDIAKARKAPSSWKKGRKDGEHAVAQELAEILGVPVAKLPQESTAAAVAEVLGVPVEKLVIDAAKEQHTLEARLRAKVTLIKGATADALTKAREVTNLGDKATDLQRIEAYRAQNRASLFHAEFLGLRAEVARALNSLKDLDPTNLSPRDLQKLMTALDTGNMADVARVLAEADSPAAALRVINKAVRTPFTTLVELWKANILSGITTFEANAIGALSVFMSPIDRAAMVASGKGFAAYYKAKAAAQGKAYVPEAQAKWDEVGTLFNGQLKGWSSGLHLAAAVIQSPHKTRVELLTRELKRLAAIKAVGEGLRVGSPEHAARVAEIVAHPDPAMALPLEAHARQLQKNLEKMEHLPPAEPGTPLYWAQTPFRVLSATDAVPRTMAENGERFSLATRDAINEGFKSGTPGFVKRVNDIALDPTPAREKEITAAGDFATFTQKLGKAGQALATIVNEHPSLSFVIPFVKVPINLAKWSLGYIPGLALISKQARIDLQTGGLARDKVMARQMIGGAVVGAVATAVATNVLTGGGYHMDKAERAARKLAGTWQEYSIKINGEWYSYARIQPMAGAVMLMSDTLELGSAYFDENKRDKAMVGAVISAVGNATISQTYLLGLSNLVRAITDPSRYADRWADQYAASMVPLSGLIGQIAAGMDPHAREINSIFDAMQARIPIWREELLPVRNPLTGQPTMPDRAWPLAPIKKVTPSEDKVLLWAAKLGIRVANAPKAVHVGKNSGKLGQVEIDAEHRNEYVRVQGEVAHDALQRIVERPGWEKIPDIRKRDIYARVLQKARQRAVWVALPPEVRREEARRISEEVRAEYAKTPGVLDGGALDLGIVPAE